MFIKTILNGIYGKFLEKHKILNKDDENYGLYQTGNFFNPFVASYILAGARQSVFNLLAQVDNKNILACFTDSVLIKEKIDIPDGKELGQWGYEQEGEAVLIGCGVYTINAPNKLKTRIRGFNTGYKINLFTEMEKNAEQKLHELTEDARNKVLRQGKKLDESMFIQIKNNVTPLSACIQNRTDQMNYLQDDVKSININFDTKRLWDGNFKNSRQLLEKNIDSYPMFHNS
jgi:hypothetical protein